MPKVATERGDYRRDRAATITTRLSCSTCGEIELARCGHNRNSEPDVRYNRRGELEIWPRSTVLVGWLLVLF